MSWIKLILENKGHRNLGHAYADMCMHMHAPDLHTWVCVRMLGFQKL